VRLQLLVPIIAQWDDHEVTEQLVSQRSFIADDEYTVKSMQALVIARNAGISRYVAGPDKPSGEPMRV